MTKYWSVLMLTRCGPIPPQKGISTATKPLLAVYFFLALAILAGVIHGVPRQSDYEIFFRTGTRLRDHLPIYQSTDGIFPFKYHPAIAFFWACWSMIPKTLSKIIFEFSQIGFIGLTLRYWVSRIFGTKHSPWLLALALLCSLKMLWRELDFGQGLVATNAIF